MFLIVLAALIAAPFVMERLRKPMDDAARADAPGTFHQLTDGVTHIRRQGPVRGPVVICVHGLTTPEFVWDGIAHALEEAGFRIVTYDLWGRGYSDRPAGKQDEAFFLRQLEDLLEEMEIPETFTLMGYSMGAAISVAYAQKNPGRIDNLVMLAPAGMSNAVPGLDRWIRDTPPFGDWLALTFGGLMRKRRIRAGIAIETDPDQIEIAHKQLPATDYRGYMPAVLSSARHMLKTNQHDYYQRLESERVPTLAIWGDQDKIIPMTALGNTTQANRAVLHKTIRGATHSLPMTHAKEAAELIKQFLLKA